MYSILSCVSFFSFVQILSKDVFRRRCYALDQPISWRLLCKIISFVVVFINRKSWHIIRMNILSKQIELRGEIEHK